MTRSRRRPRPRSPSPWDADAQVAFRAWGPVILRCRYRCQSATSQHVRASRDYPGPGKLPQQADQRGQLATGQPLAELHTGIATATVPAFAQRHPGHPGDAVACVDHGYAIGLLGFARPRFHLNFVAQVRPGHQELETAPNADERTPCAAAKYLDTLGSQAPALTGDPPLIRKRGHRVRHIATLGSRARDVPVRTAPNGESGSLTDTPHSGSPANGQVRRLGPRSLQAGGSSRPSPWTWWASSVSVRDVVLR